MAERIVDWGGINFGTAGLEDTGAGVGAGRAVTPCESDKAAKKSLSSAFSDSGSAAAGGGANCCAATGAATGIATIGLATGTLPEDSAERLPKIPECDRRQSESALEST